MQGEIMGLLPPLYIPCPKGAASTLTPKACPTCAPFPQPFYTTRLHQQATTCGGAAPLSPLYSAPEGRLLNLHAEGVSNLRTFARKAGVKLQPPCFPKEIIKKAPSFESAFY